MKQTNVLKWMGMCLVFLSGSALAIEGWTFGDVGFTAYKLDSYFPGTSGLGTIGTQNPTLTVQIGKRYQITVTNFGSHPIEIIAKAATFSGIRFYYRNCLL